MITSSSMEFGMRQFRWHEQFHGIAWNSMELGERIFQWRQFRSREQFHWTFGVPISLTRAVPWNSMELGVRQFRSNEQFHGIPWILECANFADTSSSMAFHEAWGAPISMARAVPWNSMELVVRQFRWYEPFHGIPWNFMEYGVRQIRWHEQFHGNNKKDLFQFKWTWNTVGDFKKLTKVYFNAYIYIIYT